MTGIVFGSPEAKEILQKDREARKTLEKKPLHRYEFSVVGEYHQTVIVRAHDRQDAIDKFYDQNWEAEGEIWTGDDLTWTDIQEGGLV